ncbi:MAG: thiamine phosphate synthase [Acidobacteriota bacterium]
MLSVKPDCEVPSRSMFPREVRIYPITDVRLSGLCHGEQTRRVIDGGARLIQLREKNLPARDFYQQAARALQIARERGALIIINDRVDVALAVGADGVHLGQDDLPPAEARRILGNQALIGFSTHSVEHVRRALDVPVDYLAIGPIFATPSKSDSHPLVGLENLHLVRRIVGRIPLVAIGGITAANCSQVLDAGADCVALISDIFAFPAEITARTQTLVLSGRPHDS